MQRDVPGLTRSVLNTFKWSDIRALSVGVNPFSAPPGVPHNKIFRWRDEASKSEVLAFWHPYGYGGHTVQPDGSVVQLTPAQDCVYSPPDTESGGRHILCFSWRSDNQGPFEDPADVMRVFDAARAAFPGADVKASTFDAFVKQVLPHWQAFEVVTSEIGDTWIWGVASDPIKAQQFRAIQRMRSECITSESCNTEVCTCHLAVCTVQPSPHGLCVVCGLRSS